MSSNTTNPSTTDGRAYPKCEYCGNYHTYSSLMCRDMVTQLKVSTKDPTRIPNIKEAEDKMLANSGMGFIVKDAGKEAEDGL